MLLALSVLSAILGAVVGAGATYFLHRARPVLIVDNLRVTAEHGDSDKYVAGSLSLIDKVLDYPRPLSSGLPSGAPLGRLSPRASTWTF